MAIAPDQADIGHSGVDSSSGTIAFTTNQNVASGGFIVLDVGWGDATKTLSSVSGGGLTWTIDKQGVAANGSNAGAASVSAQAPSGLASGTTITATYSAATVGRAIGGTSFTGVATSTPLDTSSGPTDFSSTTAWTTASTTIANGSVLIGISHCTNTNDTSTITAGSTEAQDFGGGAGTFGQTVGYRIQATGGAFTVAGTWSGSEQGTTIAAAYKVAAGGATKAIVPAAITATSAMSGAVQKLAAVKPAAITASSAMSGNVQALKQVKPAAITATSALSGKIQALKAVAPSAITATSTVSGALTKQGAKAIVPSAITSTSTITGAVVKLAAVTPGAIIATSNMTGSVSGSSTTRFAVWSRFYKGFTGVYRTQEDATNAKRRRLTRELLDEALDLYGLPASATTGTLYYVLVRHWDGADPNVAVEHIALTQAETQAMLRRRITHGGRLADYETYTVDR